MAQFEVVTAEETVNINGTLRENGEIVEITDEERAAKLVERGDLKPVESEEAPLADASAVVDGQNDSVVDAPQAVAPTETPADVSQGTPVAPESDGGAVVETAGADAGVAQPTGDTPPTPVSTPEDATVTPPTA